MLSRVTTRVILHSAKNRAFVGPLPSNFRTALFSGTPNQQQNYESNKPTFESDNPHEKETACRIRKIFLQFPRECFGNLDALIRSGSSQDLFSDENYVEADLGISPTLLKLMRDVVSELVVFHKWGISHGNLNPQNIFLIKRERLFAKLADPGFGHGILDWEAPEQLLGEGQSAAGDMFNFGCVLFFCMSRGGHPFGKTRGERYQNIEENKRELSPVNRFPEVYHLLSNLLNPDPKMRLSAIEVLNYPLFWSAKKRFEFIAETIVFIRKRPKNDPELPLVKEIENIMQIARGERSWEFVGHGDVSRGFDEFPSLSHYTGDLVNYCMWNRGIRGSYEPYNDSLKPLYRRLDGYTRQVPWLFIHLYETIYKHCENEEWFSKYCHKQFPNAVMRSG